MIALLVMLSSLAFGADLKGVDPLCYDAATKMQGDIAAGTSDYREQDQQDFLLN